MINCGAHTSNLCQALAAFRVEKSELSIRPVWHHREDRVKAHIFVCFLAYALWKTLEQWQQRAGLGNGPRTILEELGLIHCALVVLPTVDGRELRLRCVARPEPSQLFLLERLGLELPRRLKRPALIGSATKDKDIATLTPRAWAAAQKQG